MKKRLLSLLLAVIMVLSIVPTVALADGVPAAAVAYVTDANGQPVDAEGTEEGDLGGGYYGTLAAAIAAVPADESQYTVKMVADHHLGEVDVATMYELKAKQDIVLDLNGKTISGAANNGASSRLINVVSNSKLTIDDTSAGKNGMILGSPSPEWHYGGGNNYAGSYASNTIDNRGGTLILNNGSVINACPTGSATYAIDVYEGGVTEINGGRVYTVSANAIRLFSGACKLTITGGVVESEYIAIQVHCATGVEVNISGGTISGNDPSTPYAIYNLGNKDCKFTITGGTINGDIVLTDWAFQNQYCNNNKLTISGKDTVINGEVCNDASGSDKNNTHTISGGTITGDVTLYGTSHITGGRFNGTVWAAEETGKYYDECVTGGTFDDMTNRNTATRYLKNGQLYIKSIVKELTYIDTAGALREAHKVGTEDGFSYGGYETVDPYPENTYDSHFFAKMISPDGFSFYVPYYEYYYSSDRATFNAIKAYSLTETTVYTLDSNFSTLAAFAEAGFDHQNMLGFEKDPATGQYMKYVMYSLQDSITHGVIAEGYFDRDNGDGTYDVLKAVADIRSTYTYDSEDYVSDDYYTSIQGALNDWTRLKNYYAEQYSSYNFRDYILVLCDNSNEKFTLPAGVTFVIPKGEDGNNLYAYTGTVSAPEGMAVVITEKDDGTYYTVRQEGQQTVIETKMVAQEGEGGETVLVKDQVNMGTEEAPEMKDVPDITISGKKDAEQEEDKTLADDELKIAAVEAAEKIAENKAVTEFKDVGINEALKAESEAKDKEQKVDVKVDAVVVTKESSFVIELTGATEGSGHTTDTTSYQQSFDVKPMVKAEAAPAEDAADKNQYKQDASGEWWKIIPNEDIEGEVIFRLPIESAIAKDTVAIYHKANAEVGGKGDFLGFFPIQSEIKDSKTYKFVELKASEFSVYTYEVMTSVSQNDLFAIPNGEDTYTGYESLTALTTAIGDTTDKTAILLKDYKEASIDFGHGEEQVKTPTQFILDLNGHKLQGASENSSKVTIINSDTANYNLLQATGTYANDVKGLCADGYDAKPATEGSELNNVVYKPGNDDYTVVVEVTTGTDRVEDNDEVDVFAGDTVTVTVSILGAKYAAADITLSYDKDNFAVKSAPRSGWTRNDAAGTFNFCKANPTTGAGYYEPGLMPNATFTFTVKEGNEVILKDMFSVSEVDAFITPGWSDVGTTVPAVKLNDDQLIDDWANIRLKMMNASVTPNNGLSYKEIGQKLLADGYTASNALTGAVIDDATIKYAILSRAEADGTVQMRDESGNLLFKNGDGYLVTEDTGTPAYEPAKAPAAEDYSTVQPTVTDAGDYTIFWKIDRAGYIGVSGKENVSIAPLNVTLNWTMPKDNKNAADPQGTQGDENYVPGYTPIVIKKTDMEKQNGDGSIGETDGKGDKITADYWGSYSTEGFGFSTTAVTSETIETTKNIVASVVALNQNRIATVTMTGKPDVAEANVMKAVGTYEFTADLGSNYNISNPTVTVLIDGGKIVGYDLSATTEGNSVYYDGKNHTATIMTPGENATPDVTVKYCYSTDNGETFTEWENTIPVLTNSNPFPYIVKMQLSKDSFYTQEKTFNFSIKPVQYYTEKTDYVVGWDLVLVYTDEAVPSFEYDGNVMYDVTSFKYMRAEDEHEYAHVYAIVVAGNAETGKVLPSNTALDIDGYDSYKVLLNEKGKLDVQKSDPASVDIYDLTAVQGTYNVNLIYLTGAGATGPLAELTEQQRMAIVLRADVNNDKMVDTMDCSLILKEMNK